MDPLVIVAYAVVAIVAFLLGSIPCGVLIGKVCFDCDPRSGGSGSIGATNMNRMFGWKAFAGTFVLDAAKGALAVVFARIIAGFFSFEVAWQFDLLIVLAVLFSIMGHVFCPWLGFRGGKGISTGFGSVLAAYPLVAVGLLVVFLLVSLLSKRVSAGSITAAISFPIFSAVFYAGNIPLLVTSIVAMIAVVFAHRGNIVRLAKGTEPKFSFNKGDANDAEEA